jgi:hypothetical protein
MEDFEYEELSQAEKEAKEKAKDDLDLVTKEESPVAADAPTPNPLHAWEEGTTCECDDDDDDDDDLDPTSHYDNDEICDLSMGILQETAISAKEEIDIITSFSIQCRKEIFDILLKSDIDKEKVKEKIKALQEFLASSETRTNELVDRIENLLDF